MTNKNNEKTVEIKLGLIGGIIFAIFMIAVFFLGFSAMVVVGIGFALLYAGATVWEWVSEPFKKKRAYARYLERTAKEYK